MFKDLYKNNCNMKERQEQRRQKLLQEQKKRRTAVQDDQRISLTQQKACKSRTRQRRHKLKDKYGNDITPQLSEWLRGRPENLRDWCLVPCPVGQRCLVVAHHGRTEMYSKTGILCFNFRSQLPGGEVSGRKANTMLDCVYVKENDTFYVLDVLSFGKHQVDECEAEFRFFWLRAQLDDNEHLAERNERNEKPFILLEQYDFELSARVCYAFQSYPLWPDNQPALDGYLFYHKQASYMCSTTTPLVGWLFPFMVADMLGMLVCDEYLPPADYDHPEQYMDLFDAQLAAKRVDKKRRKVAMEIASEEPTGEECSLQALLTAERELEPTGEECSLQALLTAERELELENLEELPSAGRH